MHEEHETAKYWLCAACLEPTRFEIEHHFRIRYDGENNMQTLIKGKKGLIKKLQKLDITSIQQDEVLKHAEELGVELMQDESGAVIMMDDKDMTRFINLINDDYVESSLTGQRYEIVRKKLLKPEDDEDEDKLLRQLP